MTRWASDHLKSARDRAIDRFILGNIVAFPQYLRHRVRYALQAAERRRARRRRVALTGAGVVVAVSVVALRSAQQGDNDH